MRLLPWDDDRLTFGLGPRDGVTLMEFRLLGPLEVVVDDVPQRLPGRGERALLALLVLAAGRPVSGSGLVERLWAPDTMPADPVNALQLRVSKLRRVLARWGAEGCLVRDPAGYR